MAFRNAELICTGSELLSFKNNRYVPLFASKLRGLGFRLVREHSVVDDKAQIAALVKAGLRDSDLLITCGGLGPTFDDLTRQGIALAAGLRLFHSRKAETRLIARYGFDPLPPNLKDQCLALSGAELIDNENGSAFGQVLRFGKKMLVVLPGPEKEWTPMFDGPISGRIREFFGGASELSLTSRLKIAGLTENEVEKRTAPVMKKFPGADYTVLAGPGIAEFSFTLHGADARGTEKKFASLSAACAKALDGYVYGKGEETLEGNLGEALKAKGLTLSLAESCTGGGTADAVTNIPGSSAYFIGGISAYSNRIKNRVLGVPEKVLKERGAVSAECAAAMAEGALKLFGTDYAASVTGIAGPDGGTKEKPVGLVYFAVAGKGLKTRTFSRRFRYGRLYVKRSSVNFVLDILRKIIQ